MVKDKKLPGDDEQWEDIDMKPRSLEVDETVVGTLMSIRPGKFGNVLGLDKGDGKLYYIYSSTQLDQIMTPASIGKRFRITYSGMEKTSSGQDVRIHKVQVKKEKVE